MCVKHQAWARRKWQSAKRTARTHLPVNLPPLLFLTDPNRTPNPCKSTGLLPRGSAIIYRHYGDSNRYATARRLKTHCVRQGLRLLISGDPELAMDLNIAGVHWPEKRLADAAKWRGRFALQTASAHSRAAIVRAASYGVDAVLVSTVFPSKSPSASPAMGALKFRTLCRAAPCPLYALGGVTARTAEQIARTAGLAAIDGLQYAFSG